MYTIHSITMLRNWIRYSIVSAYPLVRISRSYIDYKEDYYATIL